MDSKIKILTKYIPENAAPLIARWIDFYRCDFKISKTRNTKLGDYRSPFKGEGHKISVNYNLNQFSFLVTTVHEFAHLVTFNEYKNRVKPHGAEWKDNFKRMMVPFFELEIFPMDVKKAIVAYLHNPAASSCSDLNLYKALKIYDQPNPSMVTVEKIPTNSIFVMKNGRTFKKLERIRKRYRCVEIKTGLIYLFSPIAEVKLLNSET
ncbi:MAG: SprT-like domain-containing protein [Bacteroidetes bacterium]|nr:SprT-like domain-containing protein [Bacteroidota bacterium]MBU1483462.1 SprT-like domain-containing protein [Bacteroidota bacterium]MBU2045688.1 SprT-like domain-containing protein [Bacteroidota bacterium]MBU2269192.1 SprT-like domain-containing protein [Bacteroidota bacterium]MBU2374447.1 SprT-like domain-containing protein [Bacteroidota bacterium]